MSVQQIGLRAVFDISGFASNVNSYINSIKIIQNANAGLASSSRNMGTALSAGIGGAIGAGAIGALAQLGSAFQSLGSDIFETLKFFERLTFSLETLFAIQGKQSGEFANVAEGLEASGQAAQEYLLWLQDLAIFSPFTTEQIATGNRLLQVYRFSAQEAAGLTQILVDYASAAGTSSVQLDRVSLALGQIRTAGRLLARDALQLSEAGIPIYDFLSDYTGKSVQELMKLQEKGLIPAQVVFEALIANLKDFEGSGKRVSGTIAGLLSSLEDIKTIGQRDLFKGIFEGIRPELQNLVDALTSPEARARIVVLGEEIGSVFGVMVQDAKAMALGIISSFNSLTPAFKEGIIIFLASAAALTTFVGIVGLMSVAIATFVNPFTLAIAAVAGFTTIYIQNFDRIQNVTYGIAMVVRNVLNAVGGYFGTLAASVGTALSEAGEYISDFASDVVTWGGSIVGALADGITQGVGLITQAVSAIGDIFTFLMAPGSPPRFLPDLDEWGKDSAQTYLDAWGEADFSALDQMNSTIGGLLQSMAGAGKISELSVPQILAGARQSYAEAIDQIVNTGNLTEQALNKARKAAGPAGDAVRQQLEAFLRYRNATAQVDAAQEKLNVVTQKYKDLITPIRAEMERVNELRTKLSEENEIRNLQRLLARGGVQESLRQEAMARIEEIRTGRKLRGLEKEQDAALETGNAELDAVKKQQDEAQRLIDIVQKRIQIETESHSLMADELRIREQLAREAERLRKEQERLAKEAERLRKEQLEKQLKIAQLYLAEVKDTVSVFKQQYILADATSTAIERQNAQLELQAVLGRRIVRNDEAKELGIPQSELNRLRDIPVTLEDIGIKASEAIGNVADGIAGLGEIDLSGPFEELQRAIDGVRIQFDNAKISLDAFIERVDAALPSFLKLRGEGEETAPIMGTLGSALAGLGAGFLTARIISIIGGIGTAIATLNPVSATIIAVVSVLAAAYAGNWFNIREHTATGVAFVQTKFNELVSSPFWDELLTNVTTLRDNIVNFFLEGGLAKLIEENSVLSAISTFITDTLLPAIDTVIPYIERFGAILGVIFAPLAQGISIENIMAVFSNLGILVSAGLERLPGIVSGVFSNIGTYISDNAPIMFQAFLDFLPTIPTRVLTGLMNIWSTVVSWLSTFVPEMAAGALEMGTAFLEWLGPLAGQAIVGLGKFLGFMLRWIIGTAIPFLFKAAVWLGQAFVGFIGWAVTEFPAIALDFIGRFVSWMVTDGVPMLLTAASNMAVALLTFITRGEEEVGPSLAKFLATASSWMETYIYPALYQAMLSIGEGIILGLYDAFGQENVDPVLDTIRSIFNNILGFFTTVGGWIGAAIQFISGFVQAAQAVYDDVVTWVGAIIQFWEGFGKAASDLWDFIVRSIRVIINRFIGDAIHMVSDWIVNATQAILFITNLFAPAIQAALDIFNAVVNYFIELGVYMDGVISYFAGIPAKFIAEVAILLSTIVTETAKWLLEMTTFISVWGGTVSDTISGFTQMVWDAAVALGHSIIDGVTQGINNLVKDPQEALKGALQSLLGVGKEEVEADSPSALFAREIGTSIPAGIAKGVEEFDIAPAFRNLVTKAIGIFKNLGQGTDEETEDLTADGTTMFNTFSANVVDTFGLMTERVIINLTDFSGQTVTLVEGLLLRLLTSIHGWSMAVSGEQKLLQTGMVASLVAFGVVFATSMDGVVVAAATSFETLRPAIVAEIKLMSTDVITLLRTPETGFAARLADAFNLAGKGIGKSLSDGIVVGFVANEATMLLGIEKSLARVLSSISTTLLAGGVASEDVTGVTGASSGKFGSGLANFTPNNVNNNNRETHYHLNVRTEASSQGIMQDYGIMQTMSFDG